MSPLSPTSPFPSAGAKSRSGGAAATGGPAPHASALLLGDAVQGHGSLAPTDAYHPAPLLLGNAFAGHGSLAPALRSRPRPPRRPGRGPRLEEALVAYVVSLGYRLEHRRLQAVIARLGIGGRPPLTLAEAGRMAGLSGERVRQLEARLRKQQRAAGGKVPLPQLDSALAAVARAVPMPASGVARLLLEAGFTEGAFSAESLRCAADLVGRDLPFVFAGSGQSAVLLPRVAATAVANAPTIESRARRQAERSGAGTIEELERELAANDALAISRRQLRVVLATSGSAVLLGNGWFCFRDARVAGPFTRASLRMLAITPSQSVESLRDGLRRHNAFRHLPEPPPAAVLAEVYRQHPGFRLAGGLVSSAHSIDPAVVGPLNRRMVEILGAAPGGMMRRSQLLEACHAAGLNLTSVNLYTTYSECLERVGPGLFAARGTAAAGQAAPLKRRPGARGGGGTVHGFTPDGRPWLAGRVTPSTWANGVVHVPAELRPVIEDRHFRCYDASGALVTTLGIDRHGNSWGWTGFLRRAGAELGEVVRAVFDPTAGTALVELATEGSAPPAV